MTQKVGQANEIVRYANSTWTRMLDSRCKQDPKVVEARDLVVIGLDPGETTGYAFAVQDSMMHIGQMATPDTITGYNEVVNLLHRVQDLTAYSRDIVIVCEDYKVYAWKADTHKWAGLHTPQLIGAIRVAAYQNNIPIVFQMAVEGKTFATDDQLKLWDLYDPGMRHGRDASRHIARFRFFPQWPKTPVA
jgi:hypothetical protein